MSGPAGANEPLFTCFYTSCVRVSVQSCACIYIGVCVYGGMGGAIIGMLRGCDGDVHGTPSGSYWDVIGLGIWDDLVLRQVELVIPRHMEVQFHREILRDDCELRFV